jgi:hypothetical protein
MSANEKIPTTISGINQLPIEIKRQVYLRLIPAPIFKIFDLSENLIDEQGHDLVYLSADVGSPVAELSLFHQYGFPDPVVYGQITDTVNGQIHIMLYVINNPNSPRFDVDRLPDGTLTSFGILERNIPAELAAMQAGLAPGQIRAGLRLLESAIVSFEEFSLLLGHDRFFSEPLYYHNAVILERDGFAYLKGRSLMEQIETGFSNGGDLRKKLDGSNPFRMAQAAQSIRLRSWALHDGIMESPFMGVTMYKIVGKDAHIRTSADIDW